jgi:hypothetical protein
MRIRQIKPAFWQDPETGRWPADTQTLYQRLWAIADDVGWLEWDLDVIGALAYPYRSPAARVRHIEERAKVLVDSGRLVLHDCGCAFLTKLEANQRTAGKKAIYGYQRHQGHVSRQAVAERGYPSSTGKQSVAPESVKGKGVSGKGKEERVNGRASPPDDVKTPLFPPIGSRL